MTQLPESFREVKRIDLMRNKKEAILVNLFAIVIMIAMIVLGFVICPPFSEVVIGIHTILGMILMMVAIIIYMVLHEVVHGVFMKAFSGVKPRYGYTGLYAYAGSDALFSRKQYLIIAFAPVITLGVVLAVLNAAFYETAFWYLYVIQVVNISGAAGDFYVGYTIGRVNGDLLIRDTGTDMTVFSAR